MENEHGVTCFAIIGDALCTESKLVRYLLCLPTTGSEGKRKEGMQKDGKTYRGTPAHTQGRKLREDIRNAR